MPSLLGLDSSQKRVVFAAYVGLWVSVGLFSERAKLAGVHFDSSLAVVVSTALKLCWSILLFLAHDGTLADMLAACSMHWSLALRYFVPCILYAIYDTLSFVNIRTLGPASYFILLQSRMAVTGVVRTFFFRNQRLSANQWTGISLATFGCILKVFFDHQHHVDASDGDEVLVALKGLPGSWWVVEAGPLYTSLFVYFLLCIQILVGVIAAVYNETLLKKETSARTNVQNAFLYMDGLALMLCLSLVKGTLGSSFDASSAAGIFSSHVFPLVLLFSLAGLSTSLFLKHLDSVRKSIASALEMMAIPIAARVFFGTPISQGILNGMVFVALGTYVYSRDDGGGGGARGNGASSCGAKKDIR